MLPDCPESGHEEDSELNPKGFFVRLMLSKIYLNFRSYYMSNLVAKPAPDFTADAVMPDGSFKQIKLSDYRGKYVILFFYPLDFTFVCPTEIIAFSAKTDDFKKRNAEVIGVSIDSKFSHLAWRNTDRKKRRPG